MALRLKRFRVLNYKSCVDSGDCWLSPKITVIAGKNESGKSALLEGLSRTYNGDNIGLIDRNMGDRDRIPSAILNFEISSEELTDLLGESGTDLNEGAREQIIAEGLTLDVRSGKPLLALSDVFKPDPPVRVPDEIADSINPLLEGILNALTANSVTKPASLKSTDIRDYNLDDFRTLLSSIPLVGPVVTDGLPKLQDAVEREFQRSKQPAPADRFVDAVATRLPRIIFFSDQIDLIRYETPLSDALGDAAIQRLARIAQIDLNALAAETDTQSRKVMLSKHTAVISNLFKLSWLQDKVNVRFDVSGDNLLVEFLEERDPNQTPYRMEQRSKGFQWYISFFSRLEGEDLSQCIVLIDEPGLYLHAKAQKDLLAQLERSTAKIPQVVFSTHSPYMIDAGKPERVRTVTRREQVGTKVQNKIHADADQETITPILTAIGDAVGLGVHAAGKGNNVVWEGPSDPLFVKATATLLNAVDVLSFSHIGCMGASKVPQVCSILHGWGVNYVAVFDNDAEGRKTMNEMMTRFYSDAPCLIISPTEGTCIEDLFSPTFYSGIVVKEEVPAGKANSKHIKEIGDKVVRAKLFLERVESGEAIEVDDETKLAFETLFSAIRKKLGLPDAVPAAL